MFFVVAAHQDQTMLSVDDFDFNDGKAFLVAGRGDAAARKAKFFGCESAKTYQPDDENERRDKAKNFRKFHVFAHYTGCPVTGHQQGTICRVMFNGRLTGAKKLEFGGYPNVDALGHFCRR